MQKLEQKLNDIAQQIKKGVTPENVPVREIHIRVNRAYFVAEAVITFWGDEKISKVEKDLSADRLMVGR